MNTRLCYGEQKQPQGELDSMSAMVSNITPGDIPLAQGINIDQLKQADSDPLEIVVEIPVGKSKRNWNYTAQSLKDIVDYTNQNTLNGFLGHQKAEDVASEFKSPVTHWIGGEMRGNSAFFRGLIDADATNLKRWIRTGRIKEVSIFGYPDKKINPVTGEMDVIGYDPLSIDWTPLHRPGMPTKIVAMEMEGTSGEQLDGTFEKLKEDLREAAKTYFNTNLSDGYIYIRSIKYDDSTVIVEHEQSNQPDRLYSIPFTVINNEVVLGEKTEVVEKRVYEIAGEMTEGGIQDMKLKELMQNVKGLLQTGEVTYGEVFGEMGITTDLEVDGIKSALQAETTLGEVKELVGATGEMDIVQKVKELINKDNEAELNIKVDTAIKEKVQGEMAQDLVKKLINVELGATDEVISGEIARVLEDNTIKTLLSNKHIDMGTGTGLNQNSNGSGSVTVKKGRI